MRTLLFEAQGSYSDPGNLFTLYGVHLMDPGQTQSSLMGSKELVRETAGSDKMVT